MLIKRILSILIATISFASIGYAQDNTMLKQKINGIKRDTSFIYGEATLADKEEAIEYSNNEFVVAVKTWLNSMENNDRITTRKVDDYVKASKIIVVPRGANNWRAIVYVLKDLFYRKIVVQNSLSPDISSLSDGDGVDRNTVSKNENTNQEKLLTNSVVRSLENRKLNPELEKKFIKDLSRLKKISDWEKLKTKNWYAVEYEFGDVDFDMDPNDLDHCILVIYDYRTNQVVAVLSEKTPTRVNYQTRMIDSTENYVGYSAKWIRKK